MKRIRALKYLTILIIPALAWFSFRQSGILALTCLAFVYIMIPGLELFVKADDTNLQRAEEEMVAQDPLYDWLLYLMVPVLYLMLWDFLTLISADKTLSLGTLGKVGAMGIICGAIGINVGHELGHRNSSFEQFLAKVLLLGSLYMHFYIEHNRGHHKKVGTPEDPATGRRGELVYQFWFRSMIMSYLSAWQIENRRVSKKYGTAFSIYNEMAIFTLVQLLLIFTIYWLFGGYALSMFLGAAVLGILQLETVNYIEHYGLARLQRGDGRYERVQPWHSWNSNHIVGRLFLFELSRHSDHHFIASKKYPILQHHEDSPQMPTGYPGMMLLSLIPPLWFAIMHKAIEGLPQGTSAR